MKRSYMVRIEFEAENDTEASDLAAVVVSTFKKYAEPTWFDLRRNMFYRMFYKPMIIYFGFPILKRK